MHTVPGLRKAFSSCTEDATRHPIISIMHTMPKQADVRSLFSVYFQWQRGFLCQPTWLRPPGPGSSTARHASTQHLVLFSKASAESSSALLVSAGQVPIEAHFGQDICFWLSLQNNRLFFVLAYLVLCFASDFYCSQEVPNEFLRRRKHAACSWNRDVQWELKKHCFFPGSTWRRLHVLHRKLLPWSICAFSRTRSTTVKSSSAQTNSSTAGDHTTQTLVVVCAQNSPSFHLVTVSLQPKLWENPEEIPCRVTPLFG